MSNIKKRVKFYHDKDGSEIFAVFIDEFFNTPTEGNTLLTCYSHIGQHGPASVEYIKECKEATLTECSELKNELENRGYQLEILNK